MHRIKAAICHQFGQPLTIEEVWLADPGPGEVLVDIRACAICHSDISFAEGDWGGRLPAIYGHEAAGIIAATGNGVTGVKDGDHVVVTLVRSCGTCHYCCRDSQIMCEEVFALDRASAIRGSCGSPYEQSMRTGAFAEKVVVHESQVIAIDPDIAFAPASLLACGVLTGFGAVVNTAKVMPRDTVAVIGCGGVGLNSVQAAALSGAAVIVALDPSPDKLLAASRFGATHIFDPSREDTCQAIMALTGGRGVDYAFVTVGATAAFESAFTYLTRNGCLVIVGMPPTGVLATYDPGTMAAWNQRILGSKMGGAVISRDIPMLTEHYRAGRLKLDELVSGHYKLEDINTAIADVKKGRSLRNVIIFN